MELWYLLEASFLTQVMKDPIFFYNPIIVSILCVYAVCKFIPLPIMKVVDEIIEDYFTCDHYNTNIVVPYHVKVYFGYGSVKPTHKTLYSERFFAITHHIKKYHTEKISSLVEIINFENTKYYDINTSDFILIPKDKQKILLSEKYDIFLEVIYDVQHESNSDKNNAGNDTTYTVKKYVYKLFTPGLNKMKTINAFLSEIEEEYINDKTTKTQMIFEFQKTVIDDYNKVSIEFSETPFYTNKSFDNIFFESKQEVLTYLEPFVNLNHENHIINEKYGVPFKCVFMLHGPPGCGKSSLIKSTIKYTNRHCILVSWSKIKTCSDFASLFRPIKINNKVYNQDELIIVFEDFDANNNDVLKTRKDMKYDISSDMKVSDSMELNTKLDAMELNTKLDAMELNTKLESMMKSQMTKTNDDLTLEYILNVLDGIVELNNIIVFFTTNTLETIDPALMRVGRIDKVIKMNYINHTMLEEIINCYYPNQSYKKDKVKIKNIGKRKLSYSKVIQLVRESPTIDQFLRDL